MYAIHPGHSLHKKKLGEIMGCNLQRPLLFANRYHCNLRPEVDLNAISIALCHSVTYLNAL